MLYYTTIGKIIILYTYDIRSWSTGLFGSIVDKCITSESFTVQIWELCCKIL